MMVDLAIVWHFESESLSLKQINLDNGVNTNILNNDNCAIEIYDPRFFAHSLFSVKTSPRNNP